MIGVTITKYSLCIMSSARVRYRIVHRISLPLLKFRKNVTIRQVKFRQKFPSRLPHSSRPQLVRNGQ